MNTTVVNSIAVGSLFLFTFISGMLTTRAGRPLRNPIFTIHKLVSLATIILVLTTTQQFFRIQETTLIDLIAIIASSLLFLILVITGALLSFEREWPAIVLKLHQIAPILSLFATIFTFYLLNIPNK